MESTIKTDKMKIVYIHEHLICIGGLERILIQKMNYLTEKLHHDVYLITTSQGNHPFSFPLSKQVKHIDLGINFHSQYNYSYPKRLWIRIKMNSLFKKRAQEAIDRINPDFIIGSTAGFPEVICRLKSRAKRIMESHCTKHYTLMPDPLDTPFLRRIYYRYTANKKLRIAEKCCDAMITLTKADALAWKKARKVYVIPNFTEYILPQNSTCKPHRVIAVGRLSYSKRFDKLISVWNLVYRHFPDWNLDIYGEGIRKEELNRQIKNFHLEKVITIHPPTKNISQEYLNSSLFVLSSNYEGFALVLIEAMGCGVPCVSFDCPNGPADIIQNERNGILVKNGDIKGLADAICLLLRDEELRKKMGKNAKESVIKYSSENIMQKWERLFRELL